MNDREELKQKVMTEEDYVRAPKFSNSLAKFVARNSDGVENATIARLLMISDSEDESEPSAEEQVEQIYQEAVEMLREKMKDED